MGRQAYLTRLAFGRSAYEPPEQQQQQQQQQQQSGQSQPADSVESPEPHPSGTSGESSTSLQGQEDVAAVLTAATENGDRVYEPPEQRYNDRGRPVNPQSRAFARELRAAQNDVLAAVGVCIRNSPPDEERRSSRQDDEVQLEEDELWSSIISLSGVIIKQTSVWWVGALRDRLMAYRISPSIAFTEIVMSELRRAGFAAFFFAGTPLYYAAIFLLDEDEWINMGLNAIRRVIVATVSSREKRAAWDERLSRIRPFLLFFAELLTSPALLHMTLQGLHLSSNNLFIPPPMAFIPFSPWSPVQFTRPISLTFTGLATWAISIAESPVLMIWLYRHALVDAHGLLFHALRTRILRPVHSDSQGHGTDSDIDDDDDAQSDDSNPSTRRHMQFLDRALYFLGWSTLRVAEPPTTFTYVPTSQPRHSISIPLPTDDATDDFVSSAPPPGSTNNQGSTQDAREHSSHGINEGELFHGHDDTLDIPSSLNEAAVEVQIDGLATEQVESPPHPVSPISTVADDIADPTDASIRIASSEVDTGAVSLEIALPEEQRPVSERQQSPHRDGARSRQGMGRISHPDHPEPKAIYNVTDLSIEPAEMLSYVLSDCLANWLLIPARMLIIYRLAQQYRQPSTRELRAPFVTFGLGLKSLAFPGLRELPLIVGRVAMCCALEGLICAVFWGIECSVVITVGKKWFGWRKRPEHKPVAGEVATPSTS